MTLNASLDFDASEWRLSDLVVSPWEKAYWFFEEPLVRDGVPSVFAWFADAAFEGRFEYEYRHESDDFQLHENPFALRRDGAPLLAPLSRLRGVFGVDEDFPSVVRLRSVLLVWSEFSSFTDFLPHMSFDLASRWLRCMIDGTVKPSEYFLDVYRHRSDPDWWLAWREWGSNRLAAASKDYWPRDLKGVMMFAVHVPEFWLLADVYSEALRLSDARGIPVELCWRLVVGKYCKKIFE